ncbi:MAG: hypothetical protein V7700_06730 [Halioglobus sp.]
MSRVLLVTLFLGQVSIANSAESPTVQVIKVEIVSADGKYQLLRGGQPYVVKGAGINHTDLQSLAAHGGNSLRTWAVEHGAEPAQQLLDRAHALGLTVSLCLEIARERQGFDYNDAAAVARQEAATIATVRKYKDHPALLTWIIGNELNFDFENPKVYDAVNAISKMIHEIDPNHPTTTTISGFERSTISVIQARAPDLDFLSFQLYKGLMDLPRHLEKVSLDKPYFVTEWGAVGHWEVGSTSWGAPVEHTSSEKAENYAKSYRQVIQPSAGQLLGDYVFLWGQKQEETPTWYGMYLASGEETEAIDIMHHIWNGKWPGNRAPGISAVRLDNKTAFDNVTLSPGASYTANIKVLDPEGDAISYEWKVRPESILQAVGGDHEEVPEVIGGLIEDPTAAEITLIAPEATGAYRLYIYARDGRNHAAHANIPFFVE